MGAVCKNLNLFIYLFYLHPKKKGVQKRGVQRGGSRFCIVYTRYLRHKMFYVILRVSHDVSNQNDVKIICLYMQIKTIKIVHRDFA